MNRALLALSPLLFLASSAQAQLTPAEALTKFTVAEGLQVELFAAEPMLINPTSIDVDERGRVWVCEAVNYRVVKSGKPLYRPEGDRIVILEDTDGDGKADKSHVFYQAKDFVAPLGIAIAPYPASLPRKRGESSIAYKIFVCHHSDIVIFDDKDGDLKADGPPTKLLGGFGGFDTDHGLHGINIGPDGKLYFTVGDAGVKNVQSSDGKGPKWNSNQTDIRAGTVWRCDMDGKNLELIAHNFRNHYDCCVNSFGEIWTSDNDDDGSQQTRLCYVMPGGNYGYHPRGPGQSHWHEEQPGIVPKVLRTGFGSPSGICFYEGSLLPKKYHGQILHCDAGPREFRCFHLTPKGAGYEAEKEVLVTSSDNWFRLSDCCVAPDGSVMIADWYDPGVGGNGMGDTTRGRIYRVTPKGHKGYKVPEVKLGTNEGIIALMNSACLATRHLGNELFQLSTDKGLDSKVYDELFSFEHSVLKARLLWQKSNLIHRKNPNDFVMTFQAPRTPAEADKMRASAACIARSIWGVRLFLPLEEKDLELLGPATKRESLIGIRTMPAALSRKDYFALAKHYDGNDRFYLAALNIACGTDPARRDAILADFDKHFPEWNDKVADLVWELRPKSVLTRLPKLLDDAKLSAKQKARIVDILASSDDLAAGKSMLPLLAKDSLPEVRQRAAENLQLNLPTKWKSLIGTAEFNSAVEKLMQTNGSQAIALQVIAAAGDSEWVPKVVQLTEKDSPYKVEAIRTLGRLHSPKAVEALQKIAANDPALAVEAIEALGQHLSPMPRMENNTAALALPVLQKLLLDQKVQTNVRLAALSALAGSFNGTQWLLDAHEKKQLPQDLLADAGKLLRNSPYQGLRNRAIAVFPTPAKLDVTKLPPLTDLAKRIGDVERGKEIWAASFKGETQCAKCHIVNGRGGQIGPDLSAIGKKASRENLYESLLLPSKAIADQFLQWQIENAAGQKILGLIVEETPTAITIRDANGKDSKIPKSEIESRTKSAVSIMPDDVVKLLTEDDLIDLVEYLFTLRTEVVEKK